MAFALVFIGLVLIVTGANNTYAQLGGQLKTDFTGSKSFVLFVVAIGAVGALGYMNDFRKFSHYFMALILLSLVLSNKGFFQNFEAALANPTAPSPSASGNAAPTAAQVGSAVSNAATGNNPGSDLIGSLTTTYAINPLKKFFGIQ